MRSVQGGKCFGHGRLPIRGTFAQSRFYGSSLRVPGRLLVRKLASPIANGKHTRSFADADTPVLDLTIGAPKETQPGELRTSMTPENVKALLKYGFRQVLVEKGLGEGSLMPDQDYTAAGATVVDASTALAADVVVKLRPPTLEEIAQLKQGGLYFGFLYDQNNPDLVKALQAKKMTVFSMDRVPRTISKAQAFDALSSQLGLAGYKAVIEAATSFGRPLAGKMTAAGKIPPAKVLVCGAAVAGLESIATAKNLGAQVFATDVRSEAKEQAQACGAKFLEPHVAAAASVGGYASEQSADFVQAAQEMYQKHVPTMDIVITTALIPGRPAPKVITSEMVKTMNPGSVIVDLAAEAGGNCEVTRPGQLHVTPNGVKVIGYTDMNSRLATQSSKLYSNNVVKFIHYILDKQTAKFDCNMEEEVQRCTALLDQGTYLDLQRGPPPAAPVKEIGKEELLDPVDPQRAEVVRLLKFSCGLFCLLGTGIYAPASFVPGMLTMCLALGVGYYSVWGVVHALHSPLMSVTNAVSGLVIVGAMMTIGKTAIPGTFAEALGAAALGMACINIFGGFKITQRMLNMFRRPTDPPEYYHYYVAPGVAVPAALAYASATLGVHHAYEVGYLVSALFCIGSLCGLASQSTARLGNTLGMMGVGWGVASATIALADTLPLAAFGQMAGMASAGSVAGIYIAKSVDPMALPQLVAAFHSLVGLAAVFVSFASHSQHLLHMLADNHPLATITQCSVFGGLVIGGVTFTGSIVAYAKLDGKLRTDALAYKGRDATNIATALVTAGLFVQYLMSASTGPLWAATAISFFAGYHLVDAVGGADMPVCITVLNSYSGWALVCEGFMLENNLLLVVGSLIGSSGAILTHIMCEAMNRSIWNVVFGSYAALGEEGEVGAETGVHKEMKPDELVNIICASDSVAIVPGFGMAQGQAQFACAEMVQTLEDNGIQVRFGIHPVAGRMPGQLNVLLADAGVPYDWVQEMDEINPDLPDADVCIVIGANDVVNPGALEDPNSKLAGMPVIHVWKAKQSIVLKRSMATGYAGQANPLFFRDNNWMCFGDAKKICEQLRDGVNAHFSK